MTVENVPGDLYEKLKKRAEERGRSIDDEVIVCLKDALERPRVDADAFLARLGALQRRIAAPRLIDEILRSAKEEGRP
ncbi:MAG: Arc family DNA-binding protein [Thermodesulfobacteriota bacterium]